MRLRYSSARAPTESGLCRSERRRAVTGAARVPPAGTGSLIGGGNTGSGQAYPTSSGDAPRRAAMRRLSSSEARSRTHCAYAGVSEYTSCVKGLR